jgi:L,D-transpeptidase catalytic domain/Putative peptidoglycan binding domain
MRATVRRIAVAALALGVLVAAAPAFAQTPPPPPTIQPGVTIQGVDVAGMTEDEATTAVRAFVATPFSLTFRARTLTATPWQVGARSHVRLAVATALAAPPDTAVPLTVSIDFEQLRHYVKKLDRLLSREPRNARVRLRNLRPRLTESHKGFDILKAETRTLLKAEIKANLRGPVPIQFRYVKPKITRWNFKPVIVIRRGSHRLYLYKGPDMHRRARFGVAVGQAIYPTPLGKFTIVTKQKNPWWYPPDSDWAAGASPIPPGPGNPLGTRWMGLSASGVGIHGTPDAASIGYSVSHGCIRMRIPDAEWLFERVEVGSTVFIVRA